MKKSTEMKRSTFAIIIFSIGIVIVLVVSMAEILIEKEERLECLQWKEWSKEIKRYYLTSWQKEQCDNRGININAPVKYERRPNQLSLYF